MLVKHLAVIHLVNVIAGEDQHMVAKRIRIDDGAVLKGSIEVHSSKHRVEEFEVAAASKPAVQNAPVKSGLEAPRETAVPKKESVPAVSATHAARRVSGSSTLLEIEK